MPEKLWSGEKYLQTGLDALPSPFFIMDPGLTEVVEELFKNGEPLSPQESAPADSASE